MSQAPRTVVETCRSIEALCLDPYWTSGHRWKVEKLARDLREEVERVIERVVREKAEARHRQQHEANGQPSGHENGASGGLAL
jgi:hypothetical protein